MKTGESNPLMVSMFYNTDDDSRFVWLGQSNDRSPSKQKGRSLACGEWGEGEGGQILFLQSNKGVEPT